MDDDTRGDGTRSPSGLKPQHQPRAWKCTSRRATYCPIHGDCTCANLRRPNPDCPLHGTDTTHPNATELKK